MRSWPRRCVSSTRATDSWAICAAALPCKDALGCLVYPRLGRLRVIHVALLTRTVTLRCGADRTICGTAPQYLVRLVDSRLGESLKFS